MENNNLEENKKNNNLFLIITIIFILALGIFWFTKIKNNTNTANNSDRNIALQDIDRTEILSNEDLCFISIEGREGGLKDVYSLNISIAENGDTRGRFISLPAEKDKMTGDFFGKVTGDEEKVFHGWYDYQAEGMENTSELSIKFSGDTAHIGYGEMEDAGNVYVYKNPENVDYSLSIPAVHCGLQDELLKSL